MSRTEIERFVNDLGKKGNLLENAKPSATGLASIVAVGKSHGYNFTLDEAKSYTRCRSRQELISKQLDATAGANRILVLRSRPALCRPLGRPDPLRRCPRAAYRSGKRTLTSPRQSSPSLLFWLLLLRSWPDMPFALTALARAQGDEKCDENMKAGLVRGEICH